MIQGGDFQENNVSIFTSMHFAWMATADFVKYSYNWRRGE
jgi:hypothetical protein